ncbi:eukaryotic translation initiation factor 4 gamma 2 [Caerostris extrusa]|uniref:Eukaryotic translation initiation factor 4 gamma 2 n=1 Tax=Caerostris extrusa TaxID=172846 RepID=A0AAV4MZF8_CAEEX|nr:eukaryotic translation initiation factor 4 gamma 2 [Caerostris extrusa]
MFQKITKKDKKLFHYPSVRGSGSASRCSGGRDEPSRPDAASVAPRRWVPPSSIKRDAISPQEKNDQVFRRVRGILNKLTPEKFHKLSEELLSVGLDSTQILKGVILLIFDKALDEPKYSSMYALLCRKLCEEAPNFDPPSNNTGSHNSNTFRRLLLAKCQDEFENRRKASEAFERQDGVLSAEEEEARGVAKHKMLGNITFVGELGKQGLLHEAILHQCVQQLLAKKQRRSSPKELAQDLECLAQIMKTVGHRLDTEKAKPLMDQYFERMQVFASNFELPSRIRFMLQDVLELRHNRWVPRRHLAEHGPKTIQQVRDDAARDFGGYIHHGASQRNLPIPSGGLLNMNKLRSGLDDVFGSIPIGVGTLGTGPGVISTDTFPSYSNNMGRPTRGGMGGTANNASQPYFNRNKQFPNRDHDLFPAFQQPRQQNQNQNQLGFGGTPSNRELPPRFLKKSLQPHTGNTEEISLRPAQNSMMVKNKQTFAKPSSTSMLTSNTPNSILRESSPIIPTGPPPSALQKEPPLIVKQVTQDKNKANKQVPTKDEVMKKSEDLLTDYLQHQNTETAVKTFKEIRIPKKYMSDVLLMTMKQTIEKTDSERELLSQLMNDLKKEGQITGNHVIEALKTLFNQLSELETEVPRVKSHVAGFAARGISGEIVSLSQVAEPLEGGAHYPLFLLCLQQLHKSQGRNWLHSVFNQSKINLLSMLPEMDRTKERLADILEDRGLSFLMPLLRIQADLWKQLHADPSPTVLYRWVRDNVDTAQHSVPGFVSALISCMIKYITQETTLADGLDRTSIPEKNILDKEREMLEKFKPVFQAFLHEHPDLQLVALYSLQVHCYNSGFPKGMLLRWFMMFYDLEVIEEEAFLKWKEDVNDEYPGKGKALFQVNQWLTWLEEAEEEGSDDGDN